MAKIKASETGSTIAMLSVVSILGVSGVLVAAINPEFVSLGGFMLAFIAAFMAGIFVELAQIRQALTKTDEQPQPEGEQQNA